MNAKTRNDDPERRIRDLEAELAVLKGPGKKIKEIAAGFGTLMNGIRVGIYVLDHQGCFIFVNEVVVKRSGYPREWFAGRNASDLAPPEDRDRAKKYLDAVTRGENIADHEIDYVTSEGARIVLEVNTTRIREGGRTKGLLGISRDITRRKQVEDALKKNESRYRLLIESAPLGIISFDIKGNIVNANPKIEEIFNFFNTTDWRTGSIFKFKPFVEAGVTEDLRECIREKTAMVKEYQFAAKPGTTHLQFHLTPVPDSDDRNMGVQVIVENITKRKEIEAQVLQSHKIEAIGLLAGGIAHDFNNILWIINGNTELAKAKIPRNNKAVQYLEFVEKACKRAQALVMQIINFSRQKEQRRSPLKISSIVKESLKLLRSTIPSNIEIHQHFSNESDQVRADLTQINQVLMNLFTNAVHSMRETGGILDVSLVDLELTENDDIEGYNLKPGRYVILSVLDTGHGMDPDVIDLIFDPFFTTKGFAEHTGMGLSVVRSIVQKHGGTITVQSDQNKGAIFHVILPVMENERLSQAEKSKNLLTGNERILLVEDDKELLKMQKNLFESLGYTVFAHRDPADALKFFRKDPDRCHLVVTDQMMPKMTGAELSVAVMELRAEVPVILCTGFSETITEEKAKSIGIREYMLKPVDNSEMARTIRRVLDKG